MNQPALLPLPASRTAASWIALIGTTLLIGTDSVAHAAIVVAIAALAFPIATLVEEITRGVDEEIGYCVSLIVAVGCATAIDLGLLAFVFPVYRSLGSLPPAILAAMFVHATHTRSHPGQNVLSIPQLLIGLLLLGMGREFVGHGSLLHDVPGDASVTLFPPEVGFFLAALAPGAFIALGILLAAIQWLGRDRSSS